MTKRLYRSRKNAVISGVCGGIGEYLDVDPVLIRIIWLIALFSGVGLLIYFLCWLLIPQRPLGEYTKEDGQYQDGYYNADYEHDGNGRRERTKMLLGGGLIIIGSFSLMERFMPWFNFDLIWPVLLILGGFYLIYREKDDHDEE